MGMPEVSPVAPCMGRVLYSTLGRELQGRVPISAQCGAGTAPCWFGLLCLPPAAGLQAGTTSASALLSEEEEEVRQGPVAVPILPIACPACLGLCRGPGEEAEASPCTRRQK